MNATFTNVGTAGAVSLTLNEGSSQSTVSTYPSGGARRVRVHVWRSDDAAASTSVLLVQGSFDGVKWYDNATVTNATGMSATTGAGGAAYSVVEAFPHLRFFLSSITPGQTLSGVVWSY